MKLEFQSVHIVRCSIFKVTTTPKLKTHEIANVKPWKSKNFKIFIPEGTGKALLQSNFKRTDENLQMNVSTLVFFIAKIYLYDESYTKMLQTITARVTTTEILMKSLCCVIGLQVQFKNRIFMLFKIFCITNLTIGKQMYKNSFCI